MKRNFILLLSAAFILISSCKKETPDPSLPATSPVPGFYSQGSIFILSFERLDTLLITNSGSVPLNWALSIDTGYLSAVPASGVIQAGQLMRVLLKAAPSVPENSSFNTIAKLTGNGVSKEIEIKYGPEDKGRTFLPAETIKDVAFDQLNSMLYFISGNSTSLFRYDLKTAAFDKLPVNYRPTCIGISPDSKYAAIGQDGKVTFVDLANFTVNKTADVGFEVYDIEMSNNDMAYLSANAESGLYGLSLAGASVFNFSIQNFREKQINLALDAGGQFIYCATTQSSDNTVSKMSLGNDTPYLYRSTTHGAGANIWLSENGKLLFGDVGNVFNSDDLSSSGSFSNRGRITYAAHSLKQHSAYVVLNNIFTEVRPDVYVFDPATFALKGTIKMDKYVHINYQATKTELEAEPRFIFYNKDQDELLLVTRLTDVINNIEAPLRFPWSLQRIRL
ncbi:MAG: hypothetical protein V4658_07355 [Bacteroidota bacterium]